MTAHDRRFVLLESLADYVLAEGLEATSLRPMAKAVATSDRMILYYFKDKDAVISAVLGHLIARFKAVLAAAQAPASEPYAVLRERLHKAVLGEALWPYLRLSLQVAARAGQGDPLFAPHGTALTEVFHAWIAAQLDAQGGDHSVETAQLLLEIQGVVMLRAVGMTAVVTQAD